MSDKPKATSAGSTEGNRSAVSTTGASTSRVTSPMDNPTEQFRAMELSTRDVPRTDEELGLDPDVPTVENRAAATGPVKSADPAEPRPGTSEPTQPEPGKPDLRKQDSAATAAGLDEDTGPDAEPVADRGSETAAYAYASIPPAANTPGERSAAARRRAAENRRGTLDLGLLVLRLVVGAIFLYHGLQKLTGWFHGSGLDGTRDMMAEGGWDHPTLSTILLVVGEVGGGALLILGLATPLAAGAVLAVILNAWAWKQGMLPGFQFNSSVPTGVEIDTILAGTAVAIILTGPGKLSLDRSRGWATRPFIGSLTALLLAVVAAALTFWYLHGGNPLTGIGPFD
ncbi:DoxX family protein [Nocardia shimofusensis]|uniref:DoxX family protein n=1 Tax=Nocardia shimofusensis TaxID=228596 RepID=UPI000830C1AB|nr:DoxX family protein [Nocardia shimofusensis]